MEFTPEPGDDDLVMIACRRTTFEWVLRRAALAEGNVTMRTGVAATALLTTTITTPPTHQPPKFSSQRAPERAQPGEIRGGAGGFGGAVR